MQRNSQRPDRTGEWEERGPNRGGRGSMIATMGMKSWGQGACLCGGGWRVVQISGRVCVVSRGTSCGRYGLGYDTGRP